MVVYNTNTVAKEKMCTVAVMTECVYKLKEQVEHRLF